MKKFLIFLFVVAAVVVISAGTALAADNCGKGNGGNGCGKGNGGNGCGNCCSEYVDNDGDGICDNRIEGFVDNDGDGVCDNRGTGNYLRIRLGYKNRFNCKVLQLRCRYNFCK